MSLVATCPVVVVRLTEGGTVTLYDGDAVPPEASETHVEHLTAKGLLSEQQTSKSKPKSQPNPDPGAGDNGAQTSE